MKDGKQLYLIFQMLCYFLKRLGDNKKNVLWKPKGFSAKKVTAPTITDNCLSQWARWYANSNFGLVFK